MTIQFFDSRGLSVLIDDQDADLAAYPWNSSKNTKDGKYYINTRCLRLAGGKHVTIHRVILSRMLGRDLSSGEWADHINGDTQDNRRRNLRLASAAQNAQNRKRPCTSTSGYKGVSLVKPTGKWKAQIWKNRKHTYLGQFNTPEEAYMAYCYAAQILHGEFAKLK